MHVIELKSRPSSAVEASFRDINLTVEDPAVYAKRLTEVFDFLGLGDRKATHLPPTRNTPEGLPIAPYPTPESLLSAMGQEFTAQSYSALCLQLLDQYGDAISSWLRDRLQQGLVAPHISNSEGWRARSAHQADGTIVCHQLGFSPVTRFRVGEGVVTLSAQNARTPILQARGIPGSTLEWALSFALFPELKSEITCVDPYILHLGSSVQYDVGDWSGVSSCLRWGGLVQCSAEWECRGGSKKSLFALF